MTSSISGGGIPVPLPPRELLHVCMRFHDTIISLCLFNACTHTHTQTGLANRVVPKGKALEEALKLAKQIAAFPQACLNTDRRSAYYTTYKAESFASAVTYEYYRALPVS